MARHSKEAQCATLSCLWCGKPAKFWGGHVHRGSLKLFAGWCSREHATAGCGQFGRTGQWSCKGCHGEWTDRDGVILWSEAKIEVQ